MKRKLEKEIMDNKEQVDAYAHANFSESNTLFINKVTDDNFFKLNNILDLGCGPADIPIELAKTNSKIKIIAVDGSKSMIAYAKKQIKLLNLLKRITLVNSKLPGIKKTVKDKTFDIIISKDLLHHLPNPWIFWEEIKGLSHKGTVIYVMDLLRPKNKNDAKKMVDSVSNNESKILKTDFYNSLLAAFTIKEIKHQLKTANVKFDIKKIGNRHFLVKWIM